MILRKNNIPQLRKCNLFNKLFWKMKFQLRMLESHWKITYYLDKLVNYKNSKINQKKKKLVNLMMERVLIKVFKNIDQFLKIKLMMLQILKVLVFLKILQVLVLKNLIRKLHSIKNRKLFIVALEKLSIDI